MPAFLTTSSVLQCPHGGSISIVSSNSRAKAGAAIVRPGDTFIVAGCSLETSGKACKTVQWGSPAARVKAAGDSCLTTASVGTCQSPTGGPGGPVVVAYTQPRASGT